MRCARLLLLFILLLAGARVGRVHHAPDGFRRDQQSVRPAHAREEPQVHYLDGRGEVKRSKAEGKWRVTSRSHNSRVMVLTVQLLLPCFFSPFVALDVSSETIDSAKKIII